MNTSSTNEEASVGVRLESFQVSREMVFIFGCVVAAFVVRFLLIPENTVINGDGVYYTLLGERFVSGDFGGGISAYWSPLYSILTGISSLFFSDREFAGRFVSLIAGGLLIIPAFRLVDTFFGRPSAYIGTVILVLHPFLIQASGWVMTESIYTLVFTTCVLIGWNALTKGESSKFLLTGLLLGAAFLIKPEAIGFVVLMLALTIEAGFLIQARRFRQTAVDCSILLFGFLLLFAPYFIFLHQKTGQWTLSQKIAVNLPAADYEGEFLGLTGDGRMTMKDRIWGDDYETEYMPATTAAAREPFSVARLWSDAAILGSKAGTLVKKQIRDYFPTIIPFPFILMAAAGLFCRPWTRNRAAKEFYLFSFVACTLIGYGASTVELRYLFPIIPILMAWAAHGVVEFSEWLAKSAGSIFETRIRVRPRYAAYVLLILLLFSFTPLYANIFKAQQTNGVPFEERNAGLWIRDHAGVSTPSVISSNITAAFYAQARHLYLPAEDLRTVVEYAKLRKADHLVFSERRGNDPSLFGNEEIEDLKLVYQDYDEPGYRIVVYQVVY